MGMLSPARYFVTPGLRDQSAHVRHLGVVFSWIQRENQLRHALRADLDSL